MTTETQLFSSWYEDTWMKTEELRTQWKATSVEDISKSAWQHQQQVIDDLESKLRVLSMKHLELKDDDARYEKLRLLNPQMFTRLWKAHLSSTVQFDDIIDCLDKKLANFDQVVNELETTGKLNEKACQQCGGELEVKKAFELNYEGGMSPLVSYQHCKKCGGEMKQGKALEQSFSGKPDFIGGSVCTVSPDGTANLIDCMKCEKCGWSVK